MGDTGRSASQRISRENRRRHPDRRVVVTQSGRVAKAHAAVPEEHRPLLRDLEAAVAGEVRFDSGSRALYSTDASNYRQVPIGVVIPRSIEDAVETIAVCCRHDVPVVARGGGTSLAGETCNVAVVIDFSKYLDRVLDVDPEARLGRVEPGCVLDSLRDRAEEHDLTFGPDPATHDHNSLGGMIGNNSGGVHAVMAGLTVDNVESLDILTYRGLRMSVGRTSEEELKSILAEGGERAEIYRKLDRFRGEYGNLIRERFPNIPRRVSGYSNLDQLLPENGFNVARALVGTEGTCVTVLGATLNLVESPQERTLAVLGFRDVFEAADAVPRVLEHGPVALEGMDDLLIDFMRTKNLHVEELEVLPEGNGWLIAEFGAATQDEALAKAEACVRDLEGAGAVEAKLLRDPHEQERLWTVREAGLGATAYVPDHPDAWPGWEDTAVHRDRLGDYLRDLKALFGRHGYDASLYGHFGDGLVHCRINFDLRSEEGLSRWRRFMEEAAELVVSYDGSLSGEHGDGQARAALLEKMYGPELVQAFREFKAIWDPDWKMNPGKVVDPYPVVSNLRVGPEYQPPKLDTHFSFEDDKGMFAHAARRCVGVGKCRRTDPEGGVMCPSYQGTREEKHSTRGRARLLFEMVRGGPIDDGWRSKEVEEALDLCLACKGCKSDCPVNVDMATYKAEFRAHHYAGRLRPRASYSMGLIHRWARAGSKVPALANAVFNTPGISSLAKAVGGVSQDRNIPRFPRESFTGWFRNREDAPRGGRPVLLWPDTFNNYFRPETAIAATRLLESLGFEVRIPSRPLCCGRPLYDWGRLDMAKRLWRQTFDAIGRDVEEGVPLVGLEPACVSAFRDELPGLFPDEPLARRLKDQTYFLTEFLDRNADQLDLPRVGGKALIQMHCHHHAVLEKEAEERVLDRLGLDFEILGSGCCGMAGSFGFEAEKADLSVAIAEQALLPRLREADDDIAILANGFSCREQIEQGTGRPTVHVAELLARRMGLADA